MELEIDLKKAFAEIKKRKAKNVLLQFPEGLKTKAEEIALEIEKKSKCNAIIDIDPCFGACDIPESEAKKLKCDLIVHFGHVEFSKTKFPTIFVPLKYKLEKGKLEQAGKKLAEFLLEKNLKKIALCTTIQYIDFLEPLKKELGKNKISALIGKGIKVRNGQLLGCNFSAVKSVESKVEAVVFLGDGKFHLKIACFGSKKPLYSMNFSSMEIGDFSSEHDSFLRKRFALVEIAKSAKVFGIMVSTKSFQNRISTALELKKQIEKSGKKAIIVAGDLLKPEFLLGIKFDCLVDTACPRIALDDSINFKVPVLTPNELDVVLGQTETLFQLHRENFPMKKKWENFKLNELY